MPEFMRKFGAVRHTGHLRPAEPALRAVSPRSAASPETSKVVGPACTVKVFPGDNLMVHKSLDIAKPGDVVVIDAGGSRMNAALGNLISTKAQHRRIAAFVIDGYVRDLPEVLQLDFPVFARGTTSIGPLHRGPGEINYPICCGGVVVNPGDVVVADALGVVIVPKDNAEEILERLEAYRGEEQGLLRRHQEGRLLEPVGRRHACRARLRHHP